MEMASTTVGMDLYQKMFLRIQPLNQQVGFPLVPGYL